MLVVPTLLLALALLLGLEAFVAGLRRATESIRPTQPGHKLLAALLLLFERGLGGGKQLALSLTSVILCAMLVAILVLAIGVYQLVELKSDEMRAMRGLRQEMQPAKVTSQRRSG